MRVFVATTLTPGLDLVGPLERAQSDVTVLRRVEDAAELLAVARSGTVDVLLLAGDLTPLTRGLLAELDGLARPVGIVAVSEVSADRARARGLGVRALRADAEPVDLADELAAAARDAQTGRRHLRSEDDPAAAGHVADDVEPLPEGLLADLAGERPAEPRSGSGQAPAPRTAPDADADGHADGYGASRPEEAPAEGHPRAEGDAGPGVRPHEGPDAGHGHAATAVAADTGGEEGTAARGDAMAAAQPATAPEAAASGRPRRPGRITAVWGPAGAPGRTTVAANLAAETAANGQRVLLVDADTYGPSVGVLLGLTDESAGLARAVRDADRGRLDDPALERAAVTVRVAGADLAVLTGLTRPERWPELRGPAVEAVLRRARECFDEVVVDVGFCLEEDEELSFDIPAAQRNAATLAALRTADRILAVGTGDSVGLPRLMRGVDALAEAVPDGPEPLVVVNRVRSAASGTAPQSQIAAVWRRFGPAACPSAFLPADEAACDRALLGGQLLAEAAPKSPLRKALRGIVDPVAVAGAEAAGPPSGPGSSPLRRLGSAVAATLRPSGRRSAQAGAAPSGTVTREAAAGQAGDAASTVQAQADGGTAARD